ncbi:MAG TPA: hemolysin family protein [Cyclobacteriaceae bacterium]|nr:hemolysin family protein [Cyclobacteriaceae bacterium]
MTVDVLITLFLVFLNGFFVAAEFAIVKVRASQIALQKGGMAKNSAQLIIDNLDGFLAATQLGITLASLGLGWFGEETATRIIINTMNALGIEFSEAAAHRIAVPVAFTMITVLHIVFGELAPKSIAIRYPTSTAISVATWLRAFYFVFRPFIWLLNGFAGLLLKIFGIKPITETEIHSEDELKLIIAESEEGGAIEPAERELIQNVFDFDDRVVRQVMIPRIKISAMKANTTVRDAINIALTEGFSRYPLYEESLEEIVGIVTIKDILQSFMTTPEKTVREIMRPVYFIPETKGVDSLLREFQLKKTQMAIVISEFGGTIGLVTLEDILEELVGEIQDEHDQESQIVTSVGNYIYQVHARSPLHDINKYLDIPIPESEDYETLAGMITSERPSVQQGDEFALSGYNMKVLKMFKTLPELVEMKLDTSKTY